MLTENDARALLAQAAETIEVGPATPVEPVRRRQWPVLAAAVATLVVGIGVWAGVAALDTDAAPGPSVDSGPVEPGPDATTVPAVFGLTEGEALKALQDAGVGRLVTVAEPGCYPPGRGLTTEPGAGAPVGATDSVRLVVTTTYANALCESLRPELFELVDFARGEDPPAFAGRVRSWVDGVESVPVDPSDPAAWADGSALTALRAVIGDARPEVAERRLLGVGESGTPSFPADCRVQDEGASALPAGLDGSSTQAWFAYQRDGETRACFVLDISTDPQGRIDAVAVRTVDPDGLLPAQTTSPDPEDLADVASTFVGFATYEVSAPPSLAADVVLYEEGEFRRTASADELTDRNAWQVCRTEGRGVTCDGTALDQVYYGVGEVPFRSSPQVPSDAPPGTVTVLTVGPPRVTSCQPRGVVTLFLDADLAVVGVDFAPDVPERLCGEEGLAPPE